MKAYCPLSRKQAALYSQAVEDLAERLETADNIQRRGVILAALMRFKQICNHPSQWLGDGGWAEEDSGKLARLREIAEIAASRQEKVLVFTQFKETTGPLEAFLTGVFGHSGLVLHGGTQVKKRKELVKLFQEDESIPFFILSLKAGGTGLNLTAASHVIHFDRWWNPAIENQATDRAFRIGQTRNVLVHKFVCRGTVEDKIDQMIEFEEPACRRFSGRRRRGAADGNGQRSFVEDGRAGFGRRGKGGVKPWLSTRGNPMCPSRNAGKKRRVTFRRWRRRAMRLHP